MVTHRCIDTLLSETAVIAQRAQAEPRRASRLGSVDAEPTKDKVVGETRRASRQRRQPLLMPQQQWQEPRCRRGLEIAFLLMVKVPRRNPPVSEEPTRGCEANTLRAERWAAAGPGECRPAEAAWEMLARPEVAAVGCEPPAPLLGAALGAASTLALRQTRLGREPGSAVVSSPRHSATRVRGCRCKTKFGERGAKSRPFPSSFATVSSPRRSATKARGCRCETNLGERGAKSRPFPSSLEGERAPAKHRFETALPIKARGHRRS